jgi:hypothetical protein
VLGIYILVGRYVFKKIKGTAKDTIFLVVTKIYL